MKREKLRLGGRQFEKIRRGDLPLGAGTDPEEVILLPHHPSDDHREFPANPALDDAYFYVGSGVASYQVSRDRSEYRIGDEIDHGFAATDVIPFLEDDWFGECFQVLEAHGWTSRGALSEVILKEIVNKLGSAEIEQAKVQFGENWESFIIERAATYFARPLSRLWYVANMMSLYYVHYDDLRLGYLWSEYRIRMRHEKDYLRGKSSVESARTGGNTRAAQLKPERQRVLDAMGILVAEGRSVAEAARRSFKAGQGKSAGANRRLWYRQPK